MPEIGPFSPRCRELTQLLQRYAYDQATDGMDYAYLFVASVNLSAALFLTLYKTTEGENAPGAQAARDALRGIANETLERLTQLMKSANPMVLAEAMGVVVKMETVEMAHGRVVRKKL